MRIVNARNRPCSQKKTYILHLLHLQLITWSQLTTNVRPTLGHTEPPRLNFRLDERPHVIHYILTVPVFKVIQDLLKPIYVSWTNIFILLVLGILFPSLKVLGAEERIAQSPSLPLIHIYHGLPLLVFLSNVIVFLALVV